MTALIAGLAIAILASCALNAGYLLQHAGSRSLPPIDVRRPAATARALGRAPLWLAGGAVGLAGWGLHVVALSAAPLSLVQAFSAGGLALAAPVAARALREPLTPHERGAIALVAAGLAMLGAGATAHTVATVPAVPLGATLAAIAAIAALVAVAPSGPRRAHALGVAGGALYGAGDAATKALLVAWHGGGALAALGSPWLWALLALTAGAFLSFQRGLQIGPAVPVIALMTAATNGVAIAIGLLVFGDPLGTSLVLAMLHAGAFAVAGAGAIVLAATQARLAADAQPAPPIPTVA